MAFRRPDGTYTLEVQVRGHRFTRETDITCPEKARKAQARFKEEKKAEVATRERQEAGTRDAKGRVRDMAFIHLAARYWEHQGQYAADRKDRSANLKRLVEWIGPETMASDIDDPLVLELRQRRRREPNRRITPGSRYSKFKEGDRVPTISNAIVNRSVTELLRTVMLFGRNELKLVLPDMPNFAKKVLSEDQREREMSHDEQIALEAALREDYMVAIDFATLTGLRKKAVIFLEWANVNFDTRLIRVGGKSRKWNYVVITPAIEFILRVCEGRDHERVFTFTAQRDCVYNPKSKRGYKKGERLPLNYQTIGTMFRRARAQAAKSIPSIADLRIHDLRHTFASRLLREGRDLLVVKRALAHSSVKVTERYLHILQEDIERHMVGMEVRSSEMMERKRSHKNPTGAIEVAKSRYVKKAW
jgi:integrase